jgi:hypothetical protein
MKIKCATLLVQGEMQASHDPSYMQVNHNQATCKQTKINLYAICYMSCAAITGRAGTDAIEATTNENIPACRLK